MEAATLDLRAARAVARPSAREAVAPMLDPRTHECAAWFTELVARAFDRALRAYFRVLSRLGELAWARDVETARAPRAAREAQDFVSSSTTAEAFIS